MALEASCGRSSFGWENGMPHDGHVSLLASYATEGIFAWHLWAA